MPSITVTRTTAGELRSYRSGATYADTIEGLDIVYIAEPTANILGQSKAASYYFAREYPMVFDVLSAFPAHAQHRATIVAVKLSVTPIMTLDLPAQTWELRYLDATNTTPSASDWVAASQLTSKPLLATADSTSWSLGNTYDFTSETDFKKYVNADGSCRFFIVSTNQRTAQAPTGSEKMTINYTTLPATLTIEYLLAQSAMMVSD